MKELKKQPTSRFVSTVHKAILGQLVEWLRDLPFVPFALVVFLTVYRLPVLMSLINQVLTYICVALHIYIVESNRAREEKPCALSSSACCCGSCLSGLRFVSVFL